MARLSILVVIAFLHHPPPLRSGGGETVDRSPRGRVTSCARRSPVPPNLAGGDIILGDPAAINIARCPDFIPAERRRVPWGAPLDNVPGFCDTPPGGCCRIVLAFST